jgi:hypothetical protein
MKQQYLKIKKFLGKSEIVVTPLAWCTVSTYVLIATLKKEFRINALKYKC